MKKKSTGISAPEAENLAGTVINRIKALEGLRYDSEVALLLHAERTAVGLWRFRDTLPWDKLIEYSRTHGVSLEWLINGNGPARTADIIESADEVNDDELIHQVLTVTEEILKEQNLELPVEKKVDLITLLVSYCRESHAAPSKENVFKLIKLAS